MNGFLLLTHVSRVFFTGEIRIFFLECYFHEGNFLGEMHIKDLEMHRNFRSTSWAGNRDPFGRPKKLSRS